MNSSLSIILSTCTILLFSSFSVVLADNLNSFHKQIIDTFSLKDPSRTNLPYGWHPSRKDISMFSLQKEKDKEFLRIQTEGGCTSIGKQYNFSTENYPLLSWKWRIHKLPVGGNEKLKDKNDSGAGIYVIFKGKFKFNDIIKYVWSSTLPEGTITNSPYNSRVRVVVLKCGNKKAGQWVTQAVNVNKDYYRLFGKKPPQVEAIGLLSDADNTNSEVMADYDDIQISN
ncbi:MAG TPA: DUF3047 domain-containing protein [Chitinispirillaceae bacterium]|nr:DUF3047 domain-containing protein [Chitinispirillaceae bacterium]